MTKRKVTEVVRLKIVAESESGEDLFVTRSPAAKIAVGNASTLRMMSRLMEMFEHEIEKLASSR